MFMALTYNPNSRNVFFYYYFFIKFKLKDFQITWANILFTIVQRLHNKCLNWEILQFYAQNELISNLMPATGLKVVGTGACLPWCIISSSFQNSLMTSGHRGYEWACTERLCSGTHWCLHRHFQHLTKPGCCPHTLQSYHHHSSPEEVISILLQWLPSSSTHSYHHEVLWTTSHAPHQVCPPPLPGPLPVCLSVQPLDRWRHRHCPPPSNFFETCSRHQIWNELI